MALYYFFYNTTTTSDLRYGLLSESNSNCVFFKVIKFKLKHLLLFKETHSQNNDILE